jgi:DNA-binding NtrC family response regulator
VAAVLVIDPDLRQQKAIQATLTGAGYAPLAANDVGAGVERLREGGIDLAVLHYSEGVPIEAFVNGLERLPDPPPFLLLSGALDAPTLSARYGAAEFLASPCNAEDLLTVVRRVLSQRPQLSSEFEEVPTRPNERKPDDGF